LDWYKEQIITCWKKFFLETITGSRIESREYIQQIERETGKNASHRAKPSFAGGHCQTSLLRVILREQKTRERRVHMP